VCLAGARKPKRTFKAFKSGPLAVSLALLGLLMLVGCSGGNNSSTTTTNTSGITVTITPTSASLTAGQTADFTATVTGTKNMAVTWEVNGVTGGSSNYGTISASGVYTAPGIIDSTVTETITATSAANTSVSATATVTLSASSSSGASSLTVSPSYAVLAAGSQQTFTATTGTSSAAVIWSVSCKATVVTDCGTISSTGAYNAPLSPPPGGSVTVTASLQDGSLNPGASSVTVQYSNATLAGQYAFSFDGQNGSSPAMELGSISFDGAGNVISGVEDSSASTTTATITGGTYHIGTDGRGSATVQTASGTETWQFVALTHSSLSAMQASSAAGTMAGSLDLQTPSQFLSAVISGNFGLLLKCPEGGAPLAQVGAVSADGAGTISQGLTDINTSSGAHSALSVTGSFTAPSSTTGRGTLTLSSSFGTQSLIYYLVDSTHLKLLDTDAASPAFGQAVKQPAGPFSVANVSGNFAAAQFGWNSSGPASVGAQFRLDGTGVSSGKLDTNINGNVQTNTAVAGSYSVTDTTFGRTQLSLTANGKTYQFVLYPTADQESFLAEVDSSVIAGPALSQQNFVITTGSLAGNFASTWTGSSFAGGNGFEAATGQVVINGGGAITGTLDIALNGVVTSGSTFTASYFVDSTGYVTAMFTSPSSALSNGTLALYPVDSQRFLSMEVDSNRILTGDSQVHD